MQAGYYIPYRETPVQKNPLFPLEPTTFDLLQQSGMATLQSDSNVPELTAVESLAGWRREFCVELLGDAVARVYVRKVEQSSFKASELQRATLFHRLAPKFADLPGCIESVSPDLRALVDTAKRTVPGKENLFAAVTYDSSAWERVLQGLDRWGRQRRP